MFQSRDDCLAALGLADSATAAEIEEVHRDLVNVWHPDRFAHNPRLRAKAEQKLKEVNSAYAFLKQEPQSHYQRRSASAAPTEPAGVVLRCPYIGCQQLVRVPAEPHSGQRVRCPQANCGRVFVIRADTSAKWRSETIDVESPSDSTRQGHDRQEPTASTEPDVMGSSPRSEKRRRLFPGLEAPTLGIAVLLLFGALLIIGLRHSESEAPDPGNQVVQPAPVSPRLSPQTADDTAAKSTAAESVTDPPSPPNAAQPAPKVPVRPAPTAWLNPLADVDRVLAEANAPTKAAPTLPPARPKPGLKPAPPFRETAHPAQTYRTPRTVSGGGFSIPSLAPLEIPTRSPNPPPPSNDPLAEIDRIIRAAREGRIVTPRPETGTEMCRADQGSNLGLLSIQNGTPYDALVALFALGTPSSVAARCVYIHAGESATVQHVVPGDYELRFSLGTDWNGVAREFTYAASYLRFVDPLHYAETTDTEGTNYVKHEVTLQPVLNGNARTESIDRSMFRLPR